MIGDDLIVPLLDEIRWHDIWNVNPKSLCLTDREHIRVVFPIPDVLHEVEASAGLPRFWHVSTQFVTCKIPPPAYGFVRKWDTRNSDGLIDDVSY